MKNIRMFMLIGCLWLVGCSTLTEAVSLAAVISEKPADKHAAQQGLITSEQNINCNDSCLY